MKALGNFLLAITSRPFGAGCIGFGFMMMTTSSGFVSQLVGLMIAVWGLESRYGHVEPKE